MIANLYQGPLRGQPFRQANLTTMGIKIVDQKSESVYVDSEVSIKKRKQQSNRLDVSRGLYKSQTYKEICKQNSLVHQDRFDSPLELSLQQPLNQTDKYTVHSKKQFSVSGIQKLFIQKLLYHLNLQKYFQKKFLNFARVLEDQGSHYNNQEFQRQTLKDWPIFNKESYEFCVLNLTMLIILLTYTIIIPIFPEYGIVIIFLTLFILYKIVDLRYFRLIDILILIQNALVFYDKKFIFLNIFMLLKIRQILEEITIFTFRKGIRFLNSIIFIIIHLNNSSFFWKYQNNDSYSYSNLLTQQIQLLFNLDYNQQELQFYDSFNRIQSFIILIYFILQFFFYIQLTDDQIKREEMFQNLLEKNTMISQPFRLQYQVRQLLWSKVSTCKPQDMISPSQLELNFPNDLRKSLNLHSFLDILQKCNFIKDKFTIQFQQSLAESAKEIIFEKGEILQYENSGVGRLMILHEGEIQLSIGSRTINRNSSNFKYQILNQYEFFACLYSPCTITALNKCKVVIIEYQQFYDMICDHSQDFQVYRMWYDRMTLTTSRCSYKICCICCENHQTYQCPYIFFQANQQKVKSNSTYTNNNPRCQYFRYEKKKVNALIQQNLISITAVNVAQQLEIMARNIENMDLYLGNGNRDEDCQLFADEDHTSKHLTQTFTHQQSIKSPKTNKTGQRGGERDRVNTDSNINRTLTIRTLKASENGTTRLKPSINDSIVVSNSPSPLQNKGMLIPKQRQSNFSSSFTIDRGQEKKSSLQSQQQPVHSTSILQSREVVVQLQSNLGSPNLLNTQTRVDYSINWHRSDTQPALFSDLIGSQLIIVKDFENMCLYQWYFPRFNYIQVIESFRRYLSKEFTRR